MCSVFVQMETRVCLTRVSTAASVKTRSGHTRVSVSKALRATTVRSVKRRILFSNHQCWGTLLLKVMHYNVALLPKKVTNYVT